MQNYASLQETQDQDEHGIIMHDAEPTRSKWNHIEDLDSFFSRMYTYHQKHGFFCMLLQRILELNQYMFVVALTTYLFHGINYSVLFDNNNLEKKVTLGDVVLPLNRCVENFNSWTWFILIIASAVWILKLLTRSYQMVYFWDIKQFYNTALGISDSDLDNITWDDIQMKIKEVQLELEMCIHKREITELDIHHRILRRENYLVAMINKRLLPPRIQIPFMGEVVYWTKSMNYNMQWLLFSSPWSPFENPWHLREEYKRSQQRKELADQFGTQVIIVSLVNFILFPVIFFWQILYMLFSYGDMIKREPGRMGIRNWSLYSKLYLRHFNELKHDLFVRLTRGYRPATKYLEAFSSPIITQIAQHVGFITGSICTVLVALTIYDEDVIAVQHIFTLITCLGGVAAICRGLIPDETTVWCPEYLLQCVVQHTHYLPSGWRGHAHTSKIRAQFQQLFQTRFAALIEELLSPILTPFFLMFWVYPRRQEIVDYLRIFTVSVTGVGDVCSFAQMDIKKHGNPEWQKESVVDDQIKYPNQYTQGEDGKVELSLMHFTTNNPSWIPPPDALTFVQSVQEDCDLSDDDEPQSFRSMANMFDPSTTDMMDFGRRSTRTKSMFKSDPSRASLLAHRKSTRFAEGPNVLGPQHMRSSVIVLHDRHYQQTMRRTQSFEETTPLLSLKNHQNS